MRQFLNDAVIRRISRPSIPEIAVLQRNADEVRYVVLMVTSPESNVYSQPPPFPPGSRRVNHVKALAAEDLGKPPTGSRGAAFGRDGSRWPADAAVGQTSFAAIKTAAAGAAHPTHRSAHGAEQLFYARQLWP
jgi:hypothetical protein